VAEQKLTYKVEADTSGAVRSLGDLGDAGEAAAKQIGDGFDQATSQTKSAISALSGELDAFEADTKGLASAIAAIKTNLTVEVDDSKVAGFAADLKNRMGVAFDDVTADAKAFAAVLERGVDLSRTRSEIRGVGDALDHTRAGADQSRSVLANLAGNSAQDLGQLGGVVGTLGVGVGQLAEYAVDGNIAMSNLAKVAGPMAALSAATLLVQNYLGNIAETKAWERDQVDAYTDAINDAGDSIGAVLQVAEDGLTGRIRDDSILGGLLDKEKTVDLIDLLDEAGLTLADVNDAIRSGAHDRTEFSDWLNGSSPEAARLRGQFDDLAGSGTRYTDVLEGVLSNTTAYTAAAEDVDQTNRVMASSLETVNEQLRLLAIDKDPLAVLSQGAIQFGQVMVDPVLLWRQLVDDLRDGKADLEGTALAVDAFAAAMGTGKDDVVALAIAQGDAAKSAGDLQHVQADTAAAVDEASQAYRDQAEAIQADLDKQQAMIDHAKGLADAQQSFRDATADLPTMLEETNAAMDEATEGSADWLDARNQQRDATEDWIDQLVTTRQEFDQANGRQRSAIQIQNDYAEGLGRVAGKLDSDVIPAVARYYADVLKIPADKVTEFEMILATGDQAAIETFVAENSGTKQLAIGVVADQAKIAKVSGAIAALASPVSTTVRVNADASAAYATKANLQQPWFTTLWVTPRTTTAVIGGRTVDFASRTVAPKGTPSTSTARAVGTAATLEADPTIEAFAVDGEADAGAEQLQTPVATSSLSAGPFGPTTFTAPARPVTVNVTVNAAVIGNRLDVQRAVLRAVRQGVRVRGAGVLVAP
jgi:hypothetical protein